MRVNSRAAWRVRRWRSPARWPLLHLSYGSDTPRSGLGDRRRSKHAQLDGARRGVEWLAAKGEAKGEDRQRRRSATSCSRRAHVVARTRRSHPASATSASPQPRRRSSCRFKVTELGGTTPKFDCDLAQRRTAAHQIRQEAGEMPAEYAATRLLQRAWLWRRQRDAMSRRLRCYGCPEEPFSMMKAVEITQGRNALQAI